MSARDDLRRHRVLYRIDRELESDYVERVERILNREAQQVGLDRVSIDRPASLSQSFTVRAYKPDEAQPCISIQSRNLARAAGDCWDLFDSIQSIQTAWAPPTSPAFQSKDKP